ncbi:MAG: hypothetical protein HPY45_13190 [Anaerolineae bacterium]|nr:hypothetical protein [Anaerolineae bacterium]
METHTFYATGVGLAFNVYNCTLQFRQELPEIPQDTETRGVNFLNHAQLSVLMSPQNAKALAALLTHFVLDYEKNLHVTLPIPDEMQKMWQEHIKTGAD